MSTKKPRNADHVRRRNVPSIDNEEVESRLKALLTPVVWQQVAYYRQLGLRDRILNLPLMVALVLTLLWRQVPSVHELTRSLAREDLLWCKAIEVRQQSLSERFLVFPAELFERVLKGLIPILVERWNERQQRPLAPAVQMAREHFSAIWIVDGSTLEALFRKLKALEDAPVGQLAGKMCAVIDLATHYPVDIWFSEQARAFDTNFIPDILQRIESRTLLLLDRGFYDFQFFAALIAKECHFITRLKSNSKVEVVRWLSDTDTVKDMLIHLGTGQNGTPILTLRLVKVRFESQWYSYVTSVLDPAILPPFSVADLYRRRWRIEEAFNILKRVLNLSYLWTGSVNGIKLQLWATWLFYVVLLDLGDAVADALKVPTERISLEMLFRGIYHFSQAHAKGRASDLVAYFAAPNNQDLGVVKTIRKPTPRLDFSPYPT
jgi:hypothetical protein